MGLFSGLRKIGRGIGRGIKKGVKAFDKFDDWIKLKELAQIGQFIPGVNVVAKPLSMAYTGYDLAKNVKEGNLLGAGLSGLQMYGTHKIPTGSKPLTGVGSPVSRAMNLGTDKVGNVGSMLKGGVGLGVEGFSSSLPTFGGAGSALMQGGLGTAAPSFLSQVGSNLSSFGNAVSNPFGLADKWQGLDKGSQFAIKTLGTPLLGSLQGGGGQSPRQSQPYYPSYQPMEYGQIQGFSPTTQLPAQAQGGITGDDWHKPINKLPANYEGWVTEPSIATLGEQGKEAVLPLNKLLPAMNKGGLNYSPGHAIVGEAGPEYITRLGPGEEHWAQKILDMPAMQAGAIAGGTGRSIWQGLSKLFSPKVGAAFEVGYPVYEGTTNPSFTLRDALPWWISAPANYLGGWLPGLAASGIAEGLNYADTRMRQEAPQTRMDMFSSDPYDDYRDRMPSDAVLAEPIVADKYQNVPNLGPGAPSAYQNGEQVLPTPGMSETEMIQRMMAGEKLPSIPIPEYIEPESPLENLMRPGGVSEAEFLQFLQGKEPAPVVPTETPPAVPVQQDPKRPLASVMALLDNENARYWADRDPERYQAMIDELSGGATDPQAAWERVAPFSTGYPAPSNQINSATHYRPKRADEWDAPAIPWGIDESPMAPLMNISRGLTNQQRQEKRNLAQSLIRSGIGGR